MVKEMELHKHVETIVTKADLIAFIEALRRDLQANPGEWENPSLERYLSALANWIEDSDGYYQNQNQQPPSTPSWKNVAEMLLAAKIYE